MAVAETTDEKVLVRAKATYVRTSARKARVVHSRIMQDFSPASH